MTRWLPHLFAFALLTSAGCSILSSDTATGNPQNALTVQVREAPPPDKMDADKPQAPGYGYIWVAGYWDYLDGNYVWRDGHWMQGKSDYEYVRARYDYDGKSWVFHRPYWKKRHGDASAAQSNG